MTRAQAGADSESPGTVTRGSAFGSAQQLVGDAGHGADHDHRQLTQGNASGYNLCGAANGSRILDRRAAKFHDYQAHAQTS
jgi:hypothetical protein